VIGARLFLKSVYASRPSTGFTRYNIAPSANTVEPITPHFQENAVKQLMTLLALSLLFGLTSMAQDSAKQDIKDAGHETKQAAKDTGHATKKTAKKAGHKVKKGTHKAAKKTEEGAQKVEDKTNPQ
jgi:hypothetical protein